MTESQNQSTVFATECQTEDGSVVHSGMLFADRVLEQLNHQSAVTASLLDLKGASSSYFNVFLRRIDEGCGIQAFQDHVNMVFDSKVQEMMFQRSLESMKRGVHSSPTAKQSPTPLEPNSDDKGAMKKWLSKLFH